MLIKKIDMNGELEIKSWLYRVVFPWWLDFHYEKKKKVKVDSFVPLKIIELIIIFLF